MNRYPYSRGHRTRQDAESVLDLLLAQGAITPDDHPKIVPTGGSTRFSIDVLRSPS